MEIRQRLELRKILAPQLRQSLNILALPLLDLKQIVDEELINNPLLEEANHTDSPDEDVSIIQLISSLDEPPPYPLSQEAPNRQGSDTFGLSPAEERLNTLVQEASLQDILLKQLGLFTSTDEQITIGQEIISRIDDSGYLKGSLEEIAAELNASVEQIDEVLKLIQQFEPAGVGARTVSECLLIQLKMLKYAEPLLLRIITHHLEDVAKKNYTRIARSLKEPLEKIEPLIKKIQRLNPKPGLNYSSERIQRVIPDIIIEEQNNGLKISINKEEIPRLCINKTYQELLKKDNLDPKTKEFLTAKLRNALELIRAIAKRKSTLRRVVETIVEIQQEALTNGPSLLKPLTFKEVSGKLNLHESTVCRVVMNKYALTPFGMMALKDFFPSHIQQENGDSVSSRQAKILIKDLVGQEDKKRPLSDHQIVKELLKENNLKLARRTVAKYREELKILSSVFRKER